MTCAQSTAGDAIRFGLMVLFLGHLFGWIVAALCSRQQLILENLALRQQLLAFQPSVLVADSRSYISCSGLPCEDFWRRKS